MPCGRMKRAETVDTVKVVLILVHILYGTVHFPCPVVQSLHVVRLLDAAVDKDLDAAVDRVRAIGSKGVGVVHSLGKIEVGVDFLEEEEEEEAEMDFLEEEEEEEI